MAAGENTLNALCARLVVRGISAERGYKSSRFLTDYVQVQQDFRPVAHDVRPVAHNFRPVARRSALEGLLLGWDLWEAPLRRVDSKPQREAAAPGGPCATRRLAPPSGFACRGFHPGSTRGPPEFHPSS